MPEALVWCESCQHVHIASIPKITYECRDCGWGQWTRLDADYHVWWCEKNGYGEHHPFAVNHVLEPFVES